VSLCPRERHLMPFLNLGQTGYPLWCPSLTKNTCNKTASRMLEWYDRHKRKINTELRWLSG